MFRSFAAVSSAKVSRLKHELHLLNKGHMIVKEYLANIKSTCDLGYFSHPISATNQVDILIVGLLTKFDSVLTVNSFSPKPQAMDHLVDILYKYKSWKRRFVLEIPLQSNMVRYLSTSRDLTTALAPPTISVSGSRVMGLFSHGGCGSWSWSEQLWSPSMVNLRSYWTSGSTMLLSVQPLD